VASHRLIGIDRMVGHSMGGSVALEIAKQHPNITTTTYGAPVFSTSGGDRYRDVFDPVSMFDFGAKSVGITVPHSSDNSASRSRYGS